MPDTAAAENSREQNNGFFVDQGTHRGRLTTPAGDPYTIRSLLPQEVTDPRTGEIATIWGGYAVARDLRLEAADSAMQREFRLTGKRPEGLFSPQSKDVPLYITLRERVGTGYTHIGSLPIPFDQARTPNAVKNQRGSESIAQSDASRLPRCSDGNFSDVAGPMGIGMAGMSGLKIQRVRREAGPR